MRTTACEAARKEQNFRMKEKIVLIGAGSAMFTRGLVRDLIEARWELDLALADTDPAAIVVAERLSRRMIETYNAPIALSASTDRRDVLANATAVICTIGVGGRRAWEQDVFIPRKYGIYQPVGDTVMPGGASRALRMIPAMVAIARDVLDLAPGALLFNYGNPMAPVCRGVHKATGADVVGLCHGVFFTGHYLASQLGCKTHDLTCTAAGMNHLTWFTEVRIGANDAMPALRELAKSKLLAEHERFINDNPFSWQLFDLFGAFPAVLDRHVSEFFPQFFARGEYYGKTLGVDAYSFEDCIAYGDELYQQMSAHALSPEPLRGDYFDCIGGEHEQAVEILKSIRGNGERVYSVSLPNRGQVPNLPHDAPVESPAITTANGFRPIMLPPLPAGVAGTLATRFAWVETIVEAALEGSRDKFIQALVLDGAVDSIDTAAKLADELLAAQAEYLPQFECLRKQ